MAQWSDPDLGDAGDDYGGCDTVRDLGFVYNGPRTDDVYGKEVPAVGFALVQGPMVRAAATDSAMFRLQYRQGFRNLDMTAFTMFVCGSSIYACSSLGDGGDAQWYRLMRGCIGHTGAGFINPLTQRLTTFVVDGDPVTSQGWIDGTGGLNSGDRGLSLATGPFTLANGDTQEIVVANLIGLGADRLSSVSMLKWYSDIVRSASNNLFNIPSPPPAPKVDVAALDGQIALYWGDPADLQPLESSRSRGYAFEGYNAYQLPGPLFTKSTAKLLATYDLVNAITTIFEDQYDEATGYILKKPLQFGADSGIRRQYVTSADALQNAALINGTAYYFAVTAYSVNPDARAVPKSLESIPQVLKVVPEKLRPGFTPAAIGDTIKTVTHASSTGNLSDGQVIATVTNPLRLTGGSYNVVFSGAGSAQTWSLVRTLGARVDTLAKNITDQSGSETGSIMVDGIQWRVTSAPNDFKRFLVVANANGPLDPPDMGTFAMNGNGFPTLDGNPANGVNDRPSSRQQKNGSKWGICTSGSGLVDGSYQRFLARVMRGTGPGVGGNWLRVVPNDYELRFTAAGGKAEMAFTSGLMVNVPFELWNIGVNTPKNASDDYRMIPWVNDLDGNDIWSLENVDNPVSGGDNDPETDWIYWMEPVNKAPGHAGYDTWVATHPQTDDATGHEHMARMVLVNFDGGSVSNPTFPANVNAQMPETGTIFRILTTKPNQPADVFTVVAPAYRYDAARAAADVEAVNVFPNPYSPFDLLSSHGSQNFVTFTHLPVKATVRVFTLGGLLVRTLLKENPGQFFQWDLKNENGYTVGSGMYIVYIDMPDLGKQKILKLGVAVQKP